LKSQCGSNMRTTSCDDQAIRKFSTTASAECVVCGGVTAGNYARLSVVDETSGHKAAKRVRLDATHTVAEVHTAMQNLLKDDAQLYEYARCCKPVIKAVKPLRKVKRNSTSSDKTLLQFVRYLARKIPKFPKTPWSQMEEPKRVERLQWISGSPPRCGKIIPVAAGTPHTLSPWSVR